MVHDNQFTVLIARLCMDLGQCQVVKSHCITAFSSTLSPCVCLGIPFLCQYYLRPTNAAPDEAVKGKALTKKASFFFLLTR